MGQWLRERGLLRSNGDRSHTKTTAGMQAALDALKSAVASLDLPQKQRELITTATVGTKRVARNTLQTFLQVGTVRADAAGSVSTSTATRGGAADCPTGHHPVYADSEEDGGDGDDDNEEGFEGEGDGQEEQQLQQEQDPDTADSNTHCCVTTSGSDGFEFPFRPPLLYNNTTATMPESSTVVSHPSVRRMLQEGDAARNNTTPVPTAASNSDGSVVVLTCQRDDATIITSSSLPQQQQQQPREVDSSEVGVEEESIAERCLLQSSNSVVEIVEGHDLHPTNSDLSGRKRSLSSCDPGNWIADRDSTQGSSPNPNPFISEECTYTASSVDTKAVQIPSGYGDSDGDGYGGAIRAASYTSVIDSVNNEKCLLTLTPLLILSLTFSLLLFKVQAAAAAARQWGSGGRPIYVYYSVPFIRWNRIPRAWAWCRLYSFCISAAR